MDILIATQNPGKFKEIAEGLAELGANFKSPADLDIHEDFAEGEDSFEANAIGKAKFYFARSKGMMVIADDSGLHVDALEGELGVTTRRWGAGHDASDDEWLAFFLNRMSKESNRSARFVCAIAMISPEEEQVFVGENIGVILDEPMAPIQKGIPLSSVFKPEECDKVYAALTADEKNLVSHRGRALTKLLNHLKHA